MIVDVTEAIGLIELDQALLVQLEDGEEAHDDLEPLGQVGGQPGERDAADLGSSSTNSTSASATLMRIGATWKRSI